jgi:hypothetical protein
MDDDYVIRRNATHHIVRCLLEPAMQKELLGLAEEEEEEELSVQEYILRLFRRLGEAGEA